jgi:hypothetical protein
MLKIYIFFGFEQIKIEYNNAKEKLVLKIFLDRKEIARDQNKSMLFCCEPRFPFLFSQALEQIS